MVLAVINGLEPLLSGPKPDVLPLDEMTMSYIS